MPGATSPLASASTRWARSSTAPARTGGSSSPTGRPPSSSPTTCAPASAAELERGGYVLWESAEPELILISTGAEVAPTLQAGRDLAGEGIAVRVVAMPCVEIFEAQSPGYRESVLPARVGARLAVEPG